MVNNNLGKKDIYPIIHSCLLTLTSNPNPNDFYLDVVNATRLGFEVLGLAGPNPNPNAFRSGCG